MNTIHQCTTLKVPLELHKGLLTSLYKEGIKCGCRNSRTQSVYNLKQKVKTNLFRLTSVTGTILKISVFVLACVVAFL